MNALRAAFMSHYDEDEDEDYEDEDGAYDDDDDASSSVVASDDAPCMCLHCASARAFYERDERDSHDDGGQCPGCGLHSTFYGTDVCTACGFLKVFRVQPGTAGSSAANPVELLSDDDE